ncbi:hypothetical protein [Agrobacterium deltaense]|uniref:hypothetical protein n=1 Tax=Agrobacterium deltaense TaxID=1183412 RepID=UPI001C6DE0CA|nr:hypothetical protein [Agrobacterium deltaense]MBW9074944.1 hypothetical protein [Agrobacterium deltaense]
MKESRHDGKQGRKHKPPHHGRDITVTGFVPVAVASTDFNGGRILGTFTAHIKPLGVTVVNMTLAHHDVTKFTVETTYKTRMTQPINVMPGGSIAAALAEAAGGLGTQ